MSDLSGFTAKDTELGDDLIKPAKAGWFSFLKASTSLRLSTARSGSIMIVLSSTIRGAQFVAAWFEGGKDDPKLQLLRLDPYQAQIWLDGSSLLAGAKVMLGFGDPKEDYKGSTANVKLD
ncbi:pyridoxamine 5'-phosphate oxidase family protein [Roseovarius sp. M141]|uniref:pyridoxamine 5'-phosphate oxidase family protein n=1 Tax=Roseovarius sp. M141 TaxID=2583806 RepID=UPI0020CCCD6A|nr:pyridoxamine 5'-phosphate oxidase family protein [Roseovarius sp. M141]